MVNNRISLSVFAGFTIVILVFSLGSQPAAGQQLPAAQASSTTAQTRVDSTTAGQAAYSDTQPNGSPLPAPDTSSKPRLKAAERPLAETAELLERSRMQPPPAENTALSAELPPVALTVVSKETGTDDRLAFTIYITANRDVQGVSVATTPPSFLTLAEGQDQWQGDLSVGQVMLLEPVYTRSAPDAGDLFVLLAGAEPYRIYIPAVTAPNEWNTASSEQESTLATLTFRGHFYYNEDADSTKPRAGRFIDIGVKTYRFLGPHELYYECFTPVGIDGSWSCTVPVDSDHNRAYTTIFLNSDQVSVQDIGDDYFYMWDSPDISIDPSSGGTYDFGSYWPPKGYDGAPHILQILHQSSLFTEDMLAEETAEIIAYWPGGTDTTYSSGNNIYISGPSSSDPDEWDESTYLYEHGKIVMNAHAQLNPPYADYCNDPGESPPCTFNFYSHENPVTAYIEGWAFFYQSVVRESLGIPMPWHYTDGLRDINLETTWHPVFETWDDSPSTVAGILWDIHDQAGDDGNSDGIGDGLWLDSVWIFLAFGSYDPPGDHTAPWDIYEYYGYFNPFSMGDPYDVMRIYYEHGINMDHIGPTGSMTLASGNAYTRLNPMPMNSTVTDNGLGVKDLHTRTSLAQPWSDWVDYRPNVVVSVPAGEGSKTVYVEYRDIAGNLSPTYSDSIILDQTKPSGSIVINSAIGGYDKDLNLSLTLNASDALAGVGEMRFSENGTTWGSWEPYATARTYTMTPGDGTRTLYVQYRDRAGNDSTAASDTIIIDTTLPIGSIRINNGALYTNQTAVALNFAVSDATTEVMAMRLANEGQAWQPREPYVNPKTYTLPSGDGIKQVNVQFVDRAINYSSTYSDTITLDTVAPTCAVTINGGADWAVSQFVQIAPLSVDAAAGLKQMRFSLDRIKWEDWLPYSETIIKRELNTAAVPMTIYAQFQDRAGNLSPICSDSIRYDNTTPVVHLTMPSTVTSSDIPVSWSATDTISGLDTYDVQMNIDGGGWTDYMMGTLITSFVYSGAEPGHVYAWRVRARDHAGNTSAYITGLALYATNFHYLPLVNK